MDYILVITRTEVGVVLLVAAGTKLLGDVREFADAVAGYRIVPAALSLAAAVTVITLEITLGLALVTGLLGSVMSVATSALLAVFAVAIAINLLRRRVIPCGCFGSSAGEISWMIVLRNAILAIVALMSAWATELQDLRRGENPSASVYAATVSIGIGLAVIAASGGAWRRLRRRIRIAQQPT